MRPGAERILVALDTPELSEAVAWMTAVRDLVGGFKIGLEFVHAQGPAGIAALQAAGADRLFFDVKLCDIPNTVAGAVRSLLRLSPWMLNVHATAGAAAMEAARAAVGSPGEGRPLLIAVTVLTSLDRAALAATGVGGSPEEQVVRLARLAQAAGMDGVVSSPREIAAIRAACGPDFCIVTPGVRPTGSSSGDQARTATPGDAVRAGADFLVIGRPITGAADPAVAAAAIADEAAAAAGVSA